MLSCCLPSHARSAEGVFLYPTVAQKCVFFTLNVGVQNLRKTKTNCRQFFFTLQGCQKGLFLHPMHGFQKRFYFTPKKVFFYTLPLWDPSKHCTCVFRSPWMFRFYIGVLGKFGQLKTQSEVCSGLSTCKQCAGVLGGF